MFAIAVNEKALFGRRKTNIWCFMGGVDWIAALFQVEYLYYSWVFSLSFEYSNLVHTWGSCYNCIRVMGSALKNKYAKPAV